jgi:hypothetical protein
MAMSSHPVPKSDPLLRRDSSPGYCVAWKLKYGFEKGRFDEEMSYGEAKKKAEELAAKEPAKVFWPELLWD